METERPGDDCGFNYAQSIEKEDKDLFQRLDGKTERLHQGMKTLIETQREYPTKNSTCLWVTS